MAIQICLPTTSCEPEPSESLTFSEFGEVKVAVPWMRSIPSLFDHQCYSPLIPIFLISTLPLTPDFIKDCTHDRDRGKQRDWGNGKEKEIAQNSPLPIPLIPPIQTPNMLIPLPLKSSKIKPNSLRRLKSICTTVSKCFGHGGHVPGYFLGDTAIFPRVNLHSISSILEGKGTKEVRGR